MKIENLDKVSEKEAELLLNKYCQYTVFNGRFWRHCFNKGAKAYCLDESDFKIYCKRHFNYASKWRILIEPLNTKDLFYLRIKYHL